mgnify:CR=1 FL=1
MTLTTPRLTTTFAALALAGVSVAAAQERLRFELGEVNAPEPVRYADTGEPCPVGERVQVLMRPDDVLHDDASPLRATVQHKAFRGAEILYTLQLASGTRVLALVPSHHNHALQEAIGVRLDMDHVIAFAPRPTRSD